MRVREGFVSNSSSSSFLIKTGPDDPLLDLAMKVIGQKQKTLSVYDVACEMLRASGRKKTLRKLRRAKDDYDYISFPSINEDTEIYRIEENPNTIYVSTCNNESFAWLEAMDKLRKYTEEIQAGDAAYDFPNFDPYDKSKKTIIFEEWESPDED